MCYWYNTRCEGLYQLPIFLDFYRRVAASWRPIMWFSWRKSGAPLAKEQNGCHLVFMKSKWKVLGGKSGASCRWSLPPLLSISLFAEHEGGGQQLSHMKNWSLYFILIFQRFSIASQILILKQDRRAFRYYIITLWIGGHPQMLRVIGAYD